MKARELIKTLEEILKVNELEDCDVDCSVDCSIEGREETYFDRCFGTELMYPQIAVKEVDGCTEPCIVLLYEKHEFEFVKNF